VDIPDRLPNSANDPKRLVNISIKEAPDRGTEPGLPVPFGGNL